ncbi:hypothetical protein N7492_010441 [Penicillium capsulatum]|uniref:Sensitive to high expression protein 9, mitochondrial n=1 Tax=Penicillium capsulatum TaxID=69766 RepID=A0A9W9HPP4_9EURO|nr:hypothetical protein N7492_010441 [Penicillium capsulatum]KAJ6112944.1 hypothetical protein N7512_008268 [Penicillium capsulatum]
MQALPYLARQSLRSSIHITRSSTPTHLQCRPAAPSGFLARPTLRSFSVCLQCRFRQVPGSYNTSNDKAKDSEEVERVARLVKEAETPEAIPMPGPDAGSVHAANISATEPPEQAAKQGKWEQLDQGPGQSDNPASADGTATGGLPSYFENRRSQWSKQFSSVMDNVQSNVFVAGQRLNDLTGYSGIEALKNEIHAQEERLRTARAQVRKSKEEYTAAINNRSTSQREINELLQRKHAWSPADLERFTLLYRNDHTNEVAEMETQEALSRAEHDAEEAAVQLSKCILSRYHEEQVWSDKIRRMSTWGTWGLMGVNVLLFLVFQIAVEPWRRQRLVKGFEDKVVEAIEKDKELNRIAMTEGIVSSMAQSTQILPETIDSTLDTPTSTSQAPLPGSGHVPVPVDVTPSSADASSMTTPSLYSRLANISSPPISVEYWRHAITELFSEHRVAISQRDLTVAVMQSAAAGAAVMGLVIALVRPR